jgi:hypothetical protein
VQVQVRGEAAAAVAGQVLDRTLLLLLVVDFHFFTY